MPTSRPRSTTLLLIAALVASAVLIAPSAADAGGGDLLISEVDYAGTYSRVEIHNPTSSAISLSGYSLETTRAGGQIVDYTLGFLGSVPAGGFIVYCFDNGQGLECTNGPQPDAPDDTAGYWRLLLNFSTEIDAVGWGGNANAETGSAPDDTGADASLSRCPMGVDTDDNGDDFRIALPSFGEANACPELLISELDVAGADGAFFEVVNIGSRAARIGGLSVGWLDENGSPAGGELADSPPVAPGDEISIFFATAPHPDTGLLVISYPNGEVIDVIEYGSQIVDPDRLSTPVPGSLSRCDLAGNGLDGDDRYYAGPRTQGEPNVCPQLVVSEIDPIASADDGEFEFVELLNVGSTGFDLRYLAVVPLDGGGTPGAGVPLGTGILAPGERVTVCPSALAPASQCDQTVAAGDDVFGDSGNAILLSIATSAFVDVIPWSPPGSPEENVDDGAGRSVSRCPDTSTDAEDLLGTPRSPQVANICDEEAEAPVRLNEVRWLGDEDFLELYNPSQTAVDLTGTIVTVAGVARTVGAASAPAGDWFTICLSATGCDVSIDGSLPDTTSTTVEITYPNGATEDVTYSPADEGEGTSLQVCPDWSTSPSGDSISPTVATATRGALNACDEVIVLVPSTIEIDSSDASATSVAFSRLTYPDENDFTQAVDSPDEVLLASDVVFADALASGALQTTRPLLLNDPEQLEPLILAEIERLGADTVRVLGGEAAISAAVVTALQAEGLTVSRTSGPTRLETAQEIADVAGVSTAGLLARAFPSTGAADPTQAFADSLAAGGWAADEQLPLLLSQTELLSASTTAHLDGSATTGVTLVGGPSALSGQVVDDLGAIGLTSTRVSGATRFATAVAIATSRGFSAQAPANTVIVLEGQAASAWEAGFTAAGLSAQMDAPILLANGDGLPQETQDFLTTSVEVDEAVTTLICATATSAACEAAEVLLGID